MPATKIQGSGNAPAGSVHAIEGTELAAFTRKTMNARSSPAIGYNDHLAGRVQNSRRVTRSIRQLKMVVPISHPAAIAAAPPIQPLIGGGRVTSNVGLCCSINQASRRLVRPRTSVTRLNISE